jgi:hypothetical protein
VKLVAAVPVEERAAARYVSAQQEVAAAAVPKRETKVADEAIGEIVTPSVISVKKDFGGGEMLHVQTEQQLLMIIDPAIEEKD